MNCVLFAVWHHLHAPSDGQHLRQCLLLVEAFSFPGQGALAFFIFQCCFLNSVPIWLRTAAERPEDWSCDNTTHLDAAIALLSIMLSQQEDIDVASVRSDQTLGPASLRDWSGDLALRLVQTVGCRFTLLRPVVLGVWRLLRTLRAVSVAGIKWDVAALHSYSLGVLEREAHSFAAGGSTPPEEAPSGDGEPELQERGSQLELLLTLNGRGLREDALTLASDLGLADNFHSQLAACTPSL